MMIKTGLPKYVGFTALQVLGSYTAEKFPLHPPAVIVLGSLTTKNQKKKKKNSPNHIKTVPFDSLVRCTFVPSQ